MSGPEPISKFWVVWNGKDSPIVRHGHAYLARKEAERLAAKYPGETFYVLGAEGVAMLPNPVVWIPTDEIPF